MTTEMGPETYLRILADLGSVTSDGLTAGTGAKRLELTPLQLVRLAQTVADADALAALGLALHYGEVRTDPFRVEILGWGREWLQAHGMAPSPARRAAKVLADLKMIEVVPRPGARGAAGKKLAVVSGSKFGLADMEVPAIRLGRPTIGQPVANRPTEKVNALVGAVGQDLANCESGAVDNPVGAVGQDLANCGSADGRLVTSSPSVDVNAQVGAVGESAANRSSTPPTRSSEKEESLLLPVPDAGGALARTDLHRFLRDERLREVLGRRRDAALLALAEVFTANRAAAVEALAFLDRPVAQFPEMDLAAFVLDLLLLDGAGAVENGTALTVLLKAKGAHLPKQPSEQFLTGLVLAVALAMDSTPRSWPAFLVHVCKQGSWRSSTGLSALLGEVWRVYSLPTPDGVTTVADPAPGVSGGLAAAQVRAGIERGTRPPLPRPAEDDQHRDGQDREGYWARLRKAAVGTHWEDDISFETLKRNFREQARLIEQYDQRQVAGED